MTGGKVEASSKEQEGTKPLAPKMPAPSLTDAKGVVQMFKYADEAVRMNFVDMITVFMGKVFGGDLAAFKLVIELASKAGITEISDEEAETLGMMLMREFHGLPKEGTEEGTGDGAAAVGSKAGVGAVVEGVVIKVEDLGTANEGMIVGQ